MSTVEHERRRAERHDWRGTTKLLMGGAILLDTRTLNVSQGGMAILADGPIAPGTTFLLRCHGPSASSKAELVAKVRAAHCLFEITEDGFVIGLAFITPSAQTALWRDADPTTRH